MDMNVHALVFVFWIYAAVTCASQSPFYTCGVDWCNDEKYCDAKTRRCEWCANKQQDCFTEKHIANCTKFCRELPCGSLDDIPYGSNNGSSYNYGTVVQYTCENGYSLIGSPLTTCVELQQWSQPPPLCQANECPLPKQIRNGWIHGSDDVVKYIPGINISYRCNDGFALHGDANLTCLLGSLWDNDVPSCELHKQPETICPLQQYIHNGWIYVPDGVKSYLPGTTITYRCNHWYILRGSAKLTCLYRSTWDNEIPICELDALKISTTALAVALAGTLAVSIAICTCIWKRQRRKRNIRNDDIESRLNDSLSSESIRSFASSNASFQTTAFKDTKKGPSVNVIAKNVTIGSHNCQMQTLEDLTKIRTTELNFEVLAEAVQEVSNEKPKPENHNVSGKNKPGRDSVANHGIENESAREIFQAKL